MDPRVAAGELYCTVFAAVDSVGRPLIVRTVARPEDWDQPLARQHPNNKEYWPPVQSQTGRRTVVKSLRSLVGNNRLIVGWDTSFDLASLGIGVCSTLTVNLATDPEVRQCLLQHMGRGVENRYLPLLDDFPRVSIPITLGMEALSSRQVKTRENFTTQPDLLRDAFFHATLWQHLGPKNTRATPEQY